MQWGTLFYNTSSSYGIILFTRRSLVLIIAQQIHSNLMEGCIEVCGISCNSTIYSIQGVLVDRVNYFYRMDLTLSLSVLQHDFTKIKYVVLVPMKVSGSGRHLVLSRLVILILISYVWPRVLKYMLAKFHEDRFCGLVVKATQKNRFTHYTSRLVQFCLRIQFIHTLFDPLGIDFWKN